jgi:curved DNA-binding protein CbpA
MSTPGEKDYYLILGADETASQHEIERLYKSLARRHHPDRGGNAEEMKAINEAYRVLGNADNRRSYDSSRQPRLQPTDAVRIAVTPPLSPASPLVPDTVAGRLAAALVFLLAGLVFLFLVRIYYIRFMWPLFIAAVFVVVYGVWKAHNAMVFASRGLGASHRARRRVWLQEFIFWSIVGVGAYGIYLLISEI